MAVDLSFLDGYQEDFAPQTASQLPLLENIPDGCYDCTCISAIVTETKGANKQPIVKCMIKFEALDQMAEKAYWLSSPENVNRMAGDLKTLGFDVDKWKKDCKLSQEIVKALAQMPGKRFKATKKHNKVKEKTYQNLYINAALEPAANAAELVKANDDLQLAAGSSGGDSCPF